MKLKYYLRGLGIGIVVTAIIMTVALGNKQPMTDEEVVERAKELGMIENTVLADIGSKDEATQENNGETGDGETDNQETDNKETDNKETDNKEISGQEKEDEETANQKNEDDEEGDLEDLKENDESTDEKQNATQKDVVSITVVGGDSSWTVAKRMEEAGLIDSAKDFDAHLCRYGYDKKISVGTYDIPTTATHEEMAKILTKSE